MRQASSLIFVMKRKQNFVTENIEDVIISIEIPLSIWTYHVSNDTKRLKLTQSMYRPEQVLRVLGGKASHIYQTIGTRKWEICHHRPPLPPTIYPLYYILLDDESSPGP